MSAVVKRKVYGAVTVGERGQVVIPAEIRKTFKIKPGDRLIVFVKPEMISLVPADEFNRFLDQAEEVLEKFRK